MNASAYKYLPPELAERLRTLGVTVRRPVEGAMQGLHRSPRHGASVEFADYREYAPGDPPGSIDWAVYARSDRYMIRRYQEETNLRGYILLDISGSMLFKEQGPLSKRDYASFLTASLLYILVNQSDSGGLVLFNDAIQKSFPAVGTIEALRPLLLALEAAEAGGRSRIEQTLHHIAEQVRSRSLVILISDLLQPPDEVLRGLRHLQHNGHQIAVLHVLDGAELSLTLTGRVDLKELETGARLMVDTDELRDAYNHEVQLYLEELRRGCADCSATYRLIDTRQPLEEALQFRGLPI
jgi:uncharacterized protein (DUF58 family)